MDKTKNKTMVVYNQKLAGFMMMNGSVLVDIAPNNDGSGRNVFYFANTAENQRIVEAYSSVKTKR